MYSMSLFSSNISSTISMNDFVCIGGSKKREQILILSKYSGCFFFLMGVYDIKKVFFRIN